MISCVIIEDQAPAQRILQKYIGDVEALELKGVFADPLAAFEFLKKTPVDVIFLDVQLPKISGIDFLDILPKGPQVVLTTAFSDYAIQGYELNIVDYLLKPFSFQRFLKAVTKLMANMDKPSAKIESESTETQLKGKEFIFIKSGHDHFKIALKDILYIKSDSDYTEVFTEEKRIITAYSLKTWNDSLLNDTFCQTHRSYIINTEKITKISGNSLFINELLIPIGRAYREHFYNNFMYDI